MRQKRIREKSLCDFPSFLFSNLKYNIYMIGAIRAAFIILPLGLFVWYMVYTESFFAAIESINNMQGRNGALVINKPDKISYGQRFAGFLENTFGEHANSEWRMFFSRSGRDLDTVIRCIEDYWFWMTCAILLISGGVMLWIFRKY